MRTSEILLSLGKFNFDILQKKELFNQIELMRKAAALSQVSLNVTFANGK